MEGTASSPLSKHILLRIASIRICLSLRPAGPQDESEVTKELAETKKRLEKEAAARLAAFKAHEDAELYSQLPQPTVTERGRRRERSGQGTMWISRVSLL